MAVRRPHIRTATDFVDIRLFAPRESTPGKAWRSLVAISVILLTVPGCTKTGSSPAARSQSESPRATPSAPARIFRNVAAESGLDFRWGHGGKAPLDILETLGHGCAFLDFDRDGLLDALLVGNRRCALFRNVGGGRFEDVTANSGVTVEGPLIGIAVGDYDNDGFPDVFVSGYGVCALYRNLCGRPNSGSRDSEKGTSSQFTSPIFEDVTKRAGVGARHPYEMVTACAFVDFDNDGLLDLFAGRYIVFRPETIRYCMYRGIKEGCGVKNYDPDFPRVYHNLGGGRFKDVTVAWGFDSSHGRCLGVAVCASDSGAGAWLYAANDELAGDLFIPSGKRYRNIGTTSGTAYNRDGLTQGGMGVDWGDYNADGRPDLAVATFQNEPKSLYRNDNGELFTETGGSMGIAAETTAFVGWTTRFFDYDNDGYLDLLFTNGHTQVNVSKIEPDRTYAQPMQLFHNEGGRRFRLRNGFAGSEFDRGINGRGGAFGDFDNDGRVDALLVDEEGPAILLRNERSSPGGWIGVSLVGVKSNRDGIGARVTVFTGSKRLVRDQSLCGGYISAHDPRLHFGVGESQSIDRIEVRWPSGHKDTLKNPPINAYVTVTEGKGPDRSSNAAR